MSDESRSVGQNISSINGDGKKVDELIKLQKETVVLLKDVKVGVSKSGELGWAEYASLGLGAIGASDKLKTYGSAGAGYLSSAGRSFVDTAKISARLTAQTPMAQAALRYGGMAGTGLVKAGAFMTNPWGIAAVTAAGAGYLGGGLYAKYKQDQIRASYNKTFTEAELEKARKAAGLKGAAPGVETNAERLKRLTQERMNAASQKTVEAVTKEVTATKELTQEKLHQQEVIESISSAQEGQLDGARLLQDKERSWFDMAKEGLESYGLKAGDIADQMRNVFEDSFSSIEQSLTNFVLHIQSRLFSPSALAA